MGVQCLWDLIEFVSVLINLGEGDPGVVAASADDALDAVLANLLADGYDDKPGELLPSQHL